MSSPFNIGFETAKGINTRLQESAQKRTLADILDRTRRNTGNIDELLSQAIQGISDPNKRNAAIKAIEGQQERLQSGEISTFLQDENPRDAIIKSNLPLTKKLDAFKLLESKEKSVSSAQNDQLTKFLLNKYVDQPTRNPNISENLNQEIEEFQQDTPPKARNIPNDDLALMSLSGNKNLKDFADTQIKIREFDRKIQNDRQSSVDKVVVPFINNLNSARETVREEIDAANEMMNAVQDGDLQFFSRDNLANFVPEKLSGRFRTAKGQRFITAGKEWLFGTVGELGPRPNQWIEQKASEALGSIGTNKYSQMIATKALQAKALKKRALIDSYDNMSDQEIDKAGKRLPGNIEKSAENRIKEINEKLAWDMTQIDDAEIIDRKGEEAFRKRILNKEKVPFGTFLTPNRKKVLLERFDNDEDKAINWAKKRGYKIPSEEFLDDENILFSNNTISSQKKLSPSQRLVEQARARRKNN